jgi:hypothetical protein
MWQPNEAVSSQHSALSQELESFGLNGVLLKADS